MLCRSFVALASSAALFAQRPFKQYPRRVWGIDPVAADWQRPGEWAFARLMYPPGPNDGYRGRFDGDWRLGMSLWTQDDPPADRAFAAAVRRLTRIDARSVEEDVNLDDGDEVYNWPWLYAVQVGEWGITQHRRMSCATICCAAASSWPTIFTALTSGRCSRSASAWFFRIAPSSISRTRPDLPHSFRSRRSLPDSRLRALRLGYKVPDYPQGPNDGKGAHWRAIYDDKGRIMVAISFNSDIGDSWEWSNRPIPRALLRSRFPHRRSTTSSTP